MNARIDLHAWIRATHAAWFDFGSFLQEPAEPYEAADEIEPEDVSDLSGVGAELSCTLQRFARAEAQRQGDVDALAALGDRNDFHPDLSKLRGGAPVLPFPRGRR